VSSERVLEGRSIVKGTAAGKLIALVGRSHEVFRFQIEADQIESELNRLAGAVEVAAKELESTRDEVSDAVGDEIGDIFGAQHLFLRDPELIGLVQERIRDRRMNSEWALTDTVTHLLERFASLESAHLRERAGDLRDVGRALLRALSGHTPPEQVARHHVGEPLVVLAHDLTPSEAIRLSRAGVLGFGLEVGGQTSHTAIIARALDLPLIAGLAEHAVALPDAKNAIIDGDSGLVILDPEPATSLRYAEAAKGPDRDLTPSINERSVTLDGVPIRLLANIDLPDELPLVETFGAEGIGLYRSEFLFIERSPKIPSEDEQTVLLHQLIDAAAPHPAVVRTFDLGGRKLAQEVIETHEDNPVLGLRGIRLTLKRRDIFKSQVRAILRATAHGPLRVMLPMVTCVDEIHEFRQLVEECGSELESEGVDFRTDFRLGAMIEVPSAALIADRLARHVDFLSLGTNDLVQYAMAVDRNNEHVAYLYQPLHPAILRMVRFVVKAAREAKVGLVVCGEVAADPNATALLLGLGLRHLSITPRALPMIKQQVRSLELSGLAAVADECLEAESAAEVESIVQRAGLKAG